MKLIIRDKDIITGSNDLGNYTRLKLIQYIWDVLIKILDLILE